MRRSPYGSLDELSERDRRVIELWKEGYRFHEIADVVPGVPSRNAVAGVVYRVRMSGLIGDRPQDAPFHHKKYPKKKNNGVLSARVLLRPITADTARPSGLADTVSGSRPLKRPAETGGSSFPKLTQSKRINGDTSVMALTHNNEPPISYEVITPRIRFDAPVSLIELSHLHCKWVLEDRDAVYNLRMYCGGRRRDASPYCQKHHKLSYNKGK